MRTFTILMLIGLLTTCLISVTYAEEEAKAKADDKEEGSDVASDEDASDDDASDDEGSDDEDDDDDDDEDGSDIDEGDEKLFEGLGDDEDFNDGPEDGLGFSDEESIDNPAEADEPWVDDENSKVINVNGTESFDDHVKEGVVMAEFYAPWCGYCKQLRPHYDNAAAQLEGKVKFIKVDATQNEELANKMKVEGFPTLFVYNNGEKSEYQGPMNGDGMVFYLNRINQPDVTDIDSEDAFNTFKTSNKVAVVTTHAADSEQGKQVAALAKQMRDRYAFARVTDAGLQSKLALNADKIAVRSSVDEEHNAQFDGELTEENLAKWLSATTAPLVIDFDSDNGDGLANLDENIPLLFVFVNKQDKDETAKLTDIATQVAKANKGKLYVATANSGNTELMEQLDMKDSKSIMALIPQKGRFLFPGKDEDITVTAENSKEWIAKYFAGNLKPSVKSAPVPTEQTGPSFSLVADSFQEEARANKKDVLVMFHLPWCGYCKKLKPTYNKLAEAFKGVENVRIADMDGDANDLDEDLNVEGFPTLILFKGDGTHATFDGKRSLLSLAKFIKDNATNEFEMPADIQKKLDEKAAKQAKKEEKKEKK